MAVIGTLNDMVGRLFDPNNHLANLGFGLLQGSGQPGTLGARIGQAGQYAATRQDAVLKNELARAKLSEHQRKQALINKLGSLPGIPEEWLPLVQAFPEEVIGPLIMSQFPTPQQKLDMLIAEAQLGKLTGADTDVLSSDISGLAAAEQAVNAYQFLQAIPGGAELSRYPSLSQIAAGGKAALKLLGLDKYGEDWQAGLLSQIPEEYREDAIKALDTISKTRSRIAGGLANTNAELANQITGLGGGNVDPAVGLQAMIDARDAYRRRVEGRGGGDVPLGDLLTIPNPNEEMLGVAPSTGAALDAGASVPDNAVKAIIDTRRRPPKKQGRVEPQGKILNEPEREKLRREFTGMQPTPRFETEAEAEAALLRDKVTIPDEGIEIYIGGRKFRVFRSDIGAGQ